jgi:hypothetical protein
LVLNKHIDVVEIASAVTPTNGQQITADQNSMALGKQNPAVARRGFD